MTDQVRPGVRYRLQRTLRNTVAYIRQLFDPPLEGHAQPLEVREAVLDDLETQVVAAGDGRYVLPHNHAVVSVLAPDERGARERLQVVLADVEAAARRRLGELRCPVPMGFGISVEYVTEPDAAWAPGQRLAVRYEHRAGASAAHPTAALPALTLASVRGDTAAPRYQFAQPRVLIGRTDLPIDHAGRPRRNDVVFTDSGSEENATVGRAHATIRFDPERAQYRLFDEGSHNGTRVVRDSTTIDVPPRNPVGIVLLSGDEVHLGRAVLRVTIGDDAPAGATPPEGSPAPPAA